jgi:predicted MFS family arabinose efflux permease
MSNIVIPNSQTAQMAILAVVVVALVAAVAVTEALGHPIAELRIALGAAIGGLVGHRVGVGSTDSQQGS